MNLFVQALCKFEEKNVCVQESCIVAAMCARADDVGLRLTSKRRRLRSRDVGRTSVSRRRRMSSPASLPLTSLGGMLFGRPLADICQQDLPRPLIQV